MGHEQLSTPESRSTKTRLINQILDFIIEKYRPKDGPKVLMWRDVMNAFHLASNPDHVVWVRDDHTVHRHWKQYGRHVLKRLEAMGFTVIPVNHNIRRYIAHDDPPTRSDKTRNNVFYNECIPSSANKTMGMAIFPRDTMKDHPLILFSRERGVKSGASHLHNSVMKAQSTNDLGHLSNGSCDKIIDTARNSVKNTFNERYPLFRVVEDGPEVQPPTP